MSALPGSAPDAPAFHGVLLVYNPNSTGGGEGKAHSLARELKEQAPDLDVQLVPTEYAGHARRIAEDAARTSKPLVVSVSGDGGYNEVVDGAMAAGDGHRTGTVVAVTSAGNANDHRRVTRRRPLAEAIAAGNIEYLDVLRLTIGGEVHYAHSYIGLGITPVVALALERGGGKGSLRELWATGREFLRFAPFEIELEAFEGGSRDGVGVGDYLGRRRYDSLIVANLSEMAKYARLSDGDPADGRFEIVSIPHRGRIRLLITGLRAAWKGLGWQPSARRLRFRTLDQELPLQLDGEVIMLPADTPVTIEMVPGALATVR